MYIKLFVTVIDYYFILKTPYCKSYSKSEIDFYTPTHITLKKEYNN